MSPNGQRSRGVNERRPFVRNPRAWPAMPIEKTQAPPGRWRVSMGPERDGLPSWISARSEAQNFRSTRRNRGMNAASLAQVKMGTEALALCIAGVLCERDPSLLAAFRESVELLYRILDDRGDHEAAAMVGAFGRALVDPAFKRPSN